jgi:hypothetical protein
MMSNKAIKPNINTVDATCPSCGNRGAFVAAGMQSIPPKVAELLGLDSIRLWHCSHCNSTISEPDLLDIAS